jgi:hypothetical protein
VPKPPAADGSAARPDAPGASDLLLKLATLPTFYGYREVLALFDGSEERFLDAWLADPPVGLPPEVRAVCRETLSPQTFGLLLLRRLIRQQDAILAALEVIATQRDPAPPPG